MYISDMELRRMKKYFRASNYLGAAQMYLMDNPLLRRKLEIGDVKPKVVGHFGTVPGQNFVYLHLNRIIKKYDLNMFYVSGPGHGGNSVVANVYLEGTYSEVYPDVSYDEKGLKKLCKQFSFPKGISSHAAPETPGSINEGGELGYSLAHAFGAVLDNSSAIAAVVVGDGEAETGPLAASWRLNGILNYKNDGVVLPILHLNGYKIANPSILARISDEEILDYFKGLGYKPYIVSGVNEDILHNRMALVMDNCVSDISQYKRGIDKRLPMIILRTKKGWTGPQVFNGKVIEGTFRAHQVPIVMGEVENSLEILEKWLRSYKPEELFDSNGTLIKELQDLVPEKGKRMGENPICNGGLLRKELFVPDFRNYGLDVIRGVTTAEDTREMGKFLRDIILKNPHNFRIFCPDEALSNRLNSVFEVTNRQWNYDIIDGDEFLNKEGRIIDSVLSEHLCEGMLEGYLLSGRYGMFASYEAFIRIVDSMVSQHAKWLKVTKELSWRKEIASLNILLTSHVWQQDHNGYTHQDPGFLNHIVTKKADIARAYLPADANCLLSVVSHCLKSEGYINAIVASKHPHYQWFSMEEADSLCSKGIDRIDFASNDINGVDVVMAASGDTPFIEVLAGAKIVRKFLPFLKIRVVYVTDLMKLQSNYKHPHGLTDVEYNEIFTQDKPIIFAFHGYSNLIHELTYKRVNQDMHVHGYMEEGTITTSFDMRVQNRIDRYNLVIDVVKHLDNIETAQRETLIKMCEDKLKFHNLYISEYGKDIPDVVDWKW